MDEFEAKRFFGYPTDEEQSLLFDQLGELAVKWRGDKAQKHVDEYHRVYKRLVELGWTGYLDVDMELPERLMPPEYKNR